VETAVGLDRLVLAHLCNAYAEEEAPTADGGTETRVVLKLHPLIAPVKAAILPLVKKDGLPEKAREVFDELRWDFLCEYDEKDTIGRRYRRQDEVGTPFCVTVDRDGVEGGGPDTVTVRERDSARQVRVPVAEVGDEIAALLDPEDDRAFEALAGTYEEIETNVETA